MMSPVSGLIAAGSCSSSPVVAFAFLRVVRSDDPSLAAVLSGGDVSKAGFAVSSSFGVRGKRTVPAGSDDDVEADVVSTGMATGSAIFGAIGMSIVGLVAGSITAAAA